MAGGRREVARTVGEVSEHTYIWERMTRAYDKGGVKRSP